MFEYDCSFPTAAPPKNKKKKGVGASGSINRQPLRGLREGPIRKKQRGRGHRAKGGHRVGPAGVSDDPALWRPRAGVGDQTENCGPSEYLLAWHGPEV